MSKRNLDDLRLEKELKSKDSMRRRNLFNRITDDRLDRYIKLVIAGLLTLITIIAFIYISDNYLKGLFSTLGMIFTAFILAFLISILLDPIMGLLGKAKVENDNVKAAIVTVLFLAVIGSLIVFVIIPTIRSIIVNSSGGEIAIRAQDTIRRFLLAMPPWATDKIESIMAELGQRLSQINPEDVVPYITSTFGGLVKVVLIMLYTVLFLFFMLKEKDKLLYSFKAIVPKRYKRHYDNFILASESVFRQYVRGHFSVILSLFIIALTTFLAIGLISGYYELVKYALLFALIIALMDLIPYIGPWIGGIIVTVLVTFVVGNFGVVLAVLIAIVVFQVLENTLLQPFIMGQSVSVHPLGILTAMLIFASLGFGVIGIILAAPIVSLIKIIGRYMKEEMEEDRLIQASIYQEEQEEERAKGCKD